MTSEDKTTPEPAETENRNLKKDYLDQVIAEEKDYGFVVPAGETDD
jgi:hypothetical protein